MVRSEQTRGLGEEPLQAAQSLRRNGSHSRCGPEASFVGVLSKSSRAATLPPCAEPSPHRSDIGDRSSRVENPCSRPLVYSALKCPRRGIPVSSRRGGRAFSEKALVPER